MIRYRPLIPLLFFLLSVGACTYSLEKDTKTTIVSSVAELSSGQSMTVSPIEMTPGFMYTIRVGYSAFYPDGRVVNLGIKMIGEEDEEDLFELEDSYWSESGKWYEDGESGTWHENNKTTLFNFRVPAKGSFRPEVRLISDNNSANPHKLSLSLQKSRPSAFGFAPFLMASFVFLVGIIITTRRRSHHIQSILRVLDVGSVFKLRGETYTVADVRTLSDDGFTPGVELRLIADSGGERFIALETYEACWEDSNGNDITVNHKFILLDIPLSDRQKETLAGEHEKTIITLDGISYRHDENNSGKTNQSIKLEGETYTSTYHARVYIPDLPSSVTGRPAYPKKSGQRIIEYITPVTSQTDESEWAIAEIVTWDELTFVTIKEWS